MDHTRRNSLVWGSILTLTGIACVWVFGYQPWHDATLRASKVTLSFTALLFTPLFLCIGVVMLVPLPPLAEPKPSMPLRARVFLALLLLGTAGSVVYFFWLRAFLKANGYDL